MGYSLFKVKTVWHYRFEIKGFKRRQRSTREVTFAKADLVASEAYEAAKLRARGEEPCPTVAGLVLLWLAAHLPPRASEAHRKVVDLFGRRHLYGLAELRLYDVTTQAVEEAWACYLATHAPASGNTWLKTLRLLFGWALECKMIRVREWRVKLLKVQKKPRILLPKAETEAWLKAFDAISSVPLQRIVRLALGMGLREQECVCARWEWLDFERETYTPGKTKGRDAKPRPVATWLMDYLRPIRERSGWIAARPDGKPYSLGQFRRHMLKANRVIGLKGLTPHRLRGSYATSLSERKVPIQDIKETLGQKDERTTMVYLEPDLERVRRAQNEIALSTGMVGRENGAPEPANLDAAGVAQ